MRHFLMLVAAFVAFSISAQQPTENRRQYRPSRVFLENADENCYEATRREADRAFGQRCWDDASLLYRAAKNCADADQKRRQEMSERLDDCRAAAELELVNRERHAIAANRADDAHELLRHADRSLAYRMADFANNYIAPPGEDNPDCQQAMFDTWYPSSAVTGIGNQYDPVQVPFCYQLGENLGNKLTVRFAGTGKQKKIYAFSGSRHLLFSWNAQTLEPDDPLPIDPAMTGFEVAPDGITFLFHSDKTLLFWRRGQELYRMAVPRIHDFCFNEKGDEFFLFDSIEMKIETLNLREVYLGQNSYKTQKQRKMEEVRIPPTFRPWITGIQPGVLDFAVSEGDIWLGYRDSLVVLRKLGAGKPWQQAHSYRLDVSMPNGMMTTTPFLRLMPGQHFAFYGNDTASALITIPYWGINTLSQIKLAGYPLAIPSTSGHTATLKTDSYMVAGKIHLYDNAGKMVYFSAVQELEFYPFMSGVLDPEGEWLIIPSAQGVLHGWRLENSQQHIFHKFSLGSQYGAGISPDGQCYISSTSDKLQVFDCLQPGNALGDPVQLPANYYTMYGLHKMSNHWVASPFPGDSMLLWNWETGKRWFLYQSDSPGISVVAFSSDEQYLAAAHTEGQIRVYRLSDGQVVATRPFSGQVREMTFVPGSNELVVLQVNTSDYDYSEKTVLRIIHPFRSDYKQRTVRLHEYNIALIAVSDQGEYLAVSDRQDIRIYDLNNLTDEMAQILPTGEGLAPGMPAEVRAIRFNPDGRSLATSYSDQRVVFWNILTGQANFKLQSPAEATYMTFEQLRIISEGNLLCLLSPNDGLLIRSLDPSAIREAIQPPNYQLIAFSPDHIREYNLDQALSYPGNFERLANSGDIPLINAFFSYYFQQAGASSNIDRVSEYCDRAFVLYSQLDTATRRELQTTMLVMYENYHWKWLIRDRPDKAEQVLLQLNRQFNKPLAGVLAEAHTALLRGGSEDLRRAVRLYADWATRMADMTTPDLYFDPSLQPVFDKFVQLAEFELIGEKQIDCLCGMFGDWRNFSLCTNLPKKADAVPFDPEMRLRWDIYKKIYLTTQTERFAEKLRLLQSAQADARQLSKQKTGLARTQLEKVTLQMGGLYLAWAKFEQGAERTGLLCQQGIALLESVGTFHQHEQRRLETLAFLYQELARYQFNKDQFDLANESCQKGYEVSSRLWPITKDTFDLRRYADELIGNQLVLLGDIQLMGGNLAAARTAYEEANNFLSLGIKSYFTGHIDLLEGNEIEAFLNYGDIRTTEDLGDVVFDLERLAERYPTRKDSILQFIPRVRAAWLSNHPRSSGVEADYRYARLQTERAVNLRRYDQAFAWNTEALRYVEQMIQGKNTAYDWAEFWADVTLNQSYYMLFNSVRDTSLYTQVIAQSQKAEERAREEGGGDFIYTSAVYFKTNMAHAYLLRNRPGDQARAMEEYKAFLDLDSGKTGSFWDVLQKDFRDLHKTGLKWPDLKTVIGQIKPPYVTLSEEEWREMGVDVR